MGLRDRLKSAAKRAVGKDANPRPASSGPPPAVRPSAAAKAAAKPAAAPPAREAREDEPAIARTGDHKADLKLENRVKAAQKREARRQRREEKEAAEEAERLQLRQQEAARRAEAAKAKQAALRDEAAAVLQAAAAAAAEAGRAAVVEHTVHVYHPDEKIDASFPCEEGEVLLDAAARAGVELPQSCLNGGCFACAGRVESGEAVMSDDQYVMEQDKIDEGFYLLCCSTVKSDVRILTHQEDQCSI